MDQSIIRVTKELKDIQKGSDLSIAVACRDADVRNLRAIIVGPHETPYEFGFFEFAFRFGKEYPSKAPTVHCLTTNSGRCRFNPNIYASGKVCLSILGTWRGDPAEEWSSAQGMESILLSIQSLMSANPYENEPGFEARTDERDQKAQKHYAQKIRHETLRISVIQRLEGYLGLQPNGSSHVRLAQPEFEDGDGVVDEVMTPFTPFKDLCKRRFLWYYESYLAAIRQGKEDVTDGQSFERMPFESPGSNTMDGRFHYADLERRLGRVKDVICAELDTWAQDGLAAKMAETTVSVNLQHQFEQVVSSFKRSDLPHAVSLENNNPFVWIITYFAQPMTSLDGGVLQLKMHFSPRFPDEQPRVIFASKIFHYRIAPDGTMCYLPNPSKTEDVKSHIEAIVSCLEEDDPAYDPRTTVNPEAAKLYWDQKSEGRKTYHRRLRRSVQDSMEDFPE